MVDKVTGIFTGMLAGYLIGMVSGFTLFDPDLDVWALLGFVLALVGAVVGIIPPFRRRQSMILGAILGFYLGWLLNFLLFGSVEENGLDLLQNGFGGFLCTTLGIIIGTIVGWRYRSPELDHTLFAITFGGFLGGLALGKVLGIDEESSMLTWAIPVILTGTALGCATWWLQQQSKNRRIS